MSKKNLTWILISLLVACVNIPIMLHAFNNKNISTFSTMFLSCMCIFFIIAPLFKIDSVRLWFFPVRHFDR